MKQNVLIYTFLILFIGKAFSSGFDIKTSSVIDLPGIEIIGNYKGSWYLIGFEKPGRLNEPPKYQIFKYAAGFPSAKTSPVYPSFGEKTIYLQTAFINNKISMFYGKCEKLAEVEALCDSREGHRQIPEIFRQDYDPNTLEPVGSAQVVFNRDVAGFAASGINIAESEDKSKTAVLIKCYYKEHGYKVILTDNNNGQGYSKIFTTKLLKEYLNFRSLKVGNNGQVLIGAKTRNDIISLSLNSKNTEPNQYRFFSIDKSGNDPALLSLNSPVERDKYIHEPVINLLNNGEIVIACDFFQNGKNDILKGILVSKYDVKFNFISKKEVNPEAKLIALASPFQDSKKENGLQYLETQKVFPLDAGNFILITEYHHVSENRDKSGPSVVQRYYIITYRMDEKLAINDFHFIPKRQASATVDYAFSVQAYRKGNEVLLFHNDDWASDDGDGINLVCTVLPDNGAEPETKKIIHTSDDFFTSMQRFYPSGDGKLLFSEEKLVDYGDISKELKLLEVTLK